ncbi:unnamed protein product, partial [Nesidiocoris tenuis]
MFLANKNRTENVSIMRAGENFAQVSRRHESHFNYSEAEVACWLYGIAQLLLALRVHY